MITAGILFGFLWQTLRITVPYALPALGAVFSERGGVVNVGLEGMMLAGAFATTAGTYSTGNPLIGLCCGIAAGLLVGALHALTTVIFLADQIVSGIAINLLALGGTKFCCQLLFSSSSNSARIVGLEQISLLSLLPSGADPFILLTALLLVASHVVIFRTKFGLRLRAVGEHPEAADSLGVNVGMMRSAGVLISGAFAGLGGAWLALDQHSFTDGMSAGRGFIALAAMIIGNWRPTGAVLACLLFGAAESLTVQLQGSHIPTQWIQVIPYVLTMVVLAGFIRRSVPPAADGVPYEKEKSGQ